MPQNMVTNRCIWSTLFFQDWPMSTSELLLADFTEDLVDVLLLAWLWNLLFWMSSTCDLLLSLFFQRHQNHRQGNVSKGSKCALALATCCTGGGAVIGRIWGNVTRECLRQKMLPAPKYLAVFFCATLSNLCHHDFSALHQCVVYNC